MQESEIVTKIAEVQAKQHANQTDIDLLESHRKKLIVDEERLKADLAEAKKPKLKDGDYGLDKDGRPSIAILRSGGDYYFYQHGVNSNHPSYKPVVIFGNIFDDLTALQEDVTEFEVKQSHRPIIKAKQECDMVKLRQANAHSIKDDYIVVSVSSLDDLILKLRQMQATLKRKQAKK